MLSIFDDYPIHQTAESLAVPVSSDRNVYDRYWFNGYERDGGFYFGVGMGTYPHRGIIDCGLSLVHDGIQYAFHGSARAEQERGSTRCGPFRIEVLEPMRSCRVVLEPNETGVECDLTFLPRTSPIEEGRQTTRRDGRVIMDATRFAQFGRWQGRIRFGEKEMEIDASRVLGTKDRSWGLRPIGEPEAGGAPSREAGGIYFLWAPIHWEDRCTHFGLFENADGSPWHFDGAVAPVYEDPGSIPLPVDPAVVSMIAGDDEVIYEPGTRRAASARITLTAADGTNEVVSLEPLLLFRMKGIGYQHPEWGHGLWKGDLALAAESWKTDEVDPLALENLHIQQVVRARSGDRVGIGVLEQVCIGPHVPSGFTEYFDGAR